ncbi:class I SAM-dependent methyltransferase [Undibacter mobilis]|uniref:Class I SAM-dependent methyltransferase n=1 Tax=Undibacter mobilis TaxID=2292256 RepID=A0A371B6E2_9BRAD|nr:class I SAM-dependent methyltransferase [Undibacter mobilis]RDV03165.1 class I SAM-dependent methyltransferase [Undibacter mobilis]
MYQPDTKRPPGDKISRICPMCDGAEMHVHFVYDKQPPLEFKFDAIKDMVYRRELHRCDRCGHLLEWINADLSRLYLADYVDKVWGDRDRIKSTFDRINSLPADRSDNAGRVANIHVYLSRCWPEGRLKAAPRLLDVGTGLGVFPYRMKQAGWDCVGIDVDATLIAHVRDQVGIAAEVADVATVEHLGQFDLISFNRVLEHVVDPVRLLASVDRLLKPDGLVYVELPDAEAAEIEGQEREEYLLGHMHVFSFASYALLIARAGFDLIACERLQEPSAKYTLRGFARRLPAGRKRPIQY